MIDRRIIALTVFLTAVTATRSWAHHGPVGAPAFYDTDQLVILEGELTEVFWRNPHVRFGLKVVDESGEDAFWELETGVPSQLESGGFTAGMFPVGGQVKAAGFVSRHRDDFLGLRNLLLARTYGLYPGEIEVGDSLLIYGRPSQFNVNRFSMRNVSINGGPVRQLLRSRTQRAAEAAAPPGPEDR